MAMNDAFEKAKTQQIREDTKYLVKTATSSPTANSIAARVETIETNTTAVEGRLNKIVNTVSIPLTTTNNTFDLSNLGGTPTLIKAWVQFIGGCNSDGNGVSTMNGHVYVDDSDVGNVNVATTLNSQGNAGSGIIDITESTSLASHTYKVSYSNTNVLSSTSGATLYVTYSIV